MDVDALLADFNMREKILEENDDMEVDINPKNSSFTEDSNQIPFNKYTENLGKAADRQLLASSVIQPPASKNIQPALCVSFY